MHGEGGRSAPQVDCKPRAIATRGRRFDRGSFVREKIPDSSFERRVVHRVDVHRQACECDDVIRGGARQQKPRAAGSSRTREDTADGLLRRHSNGW